MIDLLLVIVSLIFSGALGYCICKIQWEESIRDEYRRKDEYDDLTENIVRKLKEGKP